jgi:hypothetical protein
LRLFTNVRHSPALRCVLRCVLARRPAEPDDIAPYRVHADSRA